MTAAMEETITKNQKSDLLVARTLQLLKDSNSRIGNILEELKTIQESIRELHRLNGARKELFLSGLATLRNAQCGLKHRNTCDTKGRSYTMNYNGSVTV